MSLNTGNNNSKLLFQPLYKIIFKNYSKKNYKNWIIFLTLILSNETSNFFISKKVLDFKCDFVYISDISTALHLLEHIHQCLGVTEFNETKSHDDLKPLMSLLEDPVFRSIVTIQDSLAELNCQLCQHPSILPGDFDISPSGQLELSVPNTPVQPTGQTMYQDLYQDSSELDDQRVPIAPLVHSSSEDTSAQVKCLKFHRLNNLFSSKKQCFWNL